MKFGDLLKQKRALREWTQPEASDRIGIEQSYLSKLETGKSMPSEDVYERLVETYAIRSEELADTLFPAELDRLRTIASVRSALLEKVGGRERAKRRWLLAGVLMLGIGGGLLGLAQLGHGVAVQEYSYQSTGIVLPGEALDVFAALEGDAGSNGDVADATRVAQRRALFERIDERTISTERFRGPRFVETDGEGRRVWRLVGGQEATRTGPWRFALVPGIALLFGGLGCFFAAWRWD